MSEEILIALKEIHTRYCIPASEQNYTDKDYACMQYEKLVIHLHKEIERLNNIINGQQKRIDKTIEAIDEILVYNDLTDTTSAFGNVSRELKFYLSECETLEEFDKLKKLKEKNEN